jgi:hypothetical protein
METKSVSARPSAPDCGARSALRLAWSSCVDATRPASQLREDGLSPTRLFEALDGRALFVDHTNWQVRVFSVYDAEGLRWVQLGLEGDGCHPLTLRMSQFESVKTVVYTLIAWLSDPSATDHVLEVA